MNKIVVTGATGVIGMALIHKCIEDNIKVVAIVNPDSKRTDRIPEHPLVTIIRTRLSDYSNVCAMEELPEEYMDALDSDAFYHLSWCGTFGEARNNEEMQHSNVVYTLDAVKLAKKLRCTAFIGVGSQAEYGRHDGKLSGSTDCNPENEYGKSKLEAGIKSRKLCEELGIRHVWTRVLSIYGPYDGENTMITSTIRKLINKEKPLLTKGEQMWDYLYAKDAANALLLLGPKGVHGQIYPIGSGIARPLAEYIVELKDAIDPKLELGIGEIPYSDRQVMYLCADISGLTEDTGFKVQYDFKQGITETIKWVRDNINNG